MASRTIALAVTVAGFLGLPGAAHADLKTCTIAAGIAHDIASYRDRGLTKLDVVESIVGTKSATTSEAKEFALTVADMVFLYPTQTPRQVRGLIYETCVAQLPATAARD